MDYQNILIQINKNKDMNIKLLLKDTKLYLQNNKIGLQNYLTGLTMLIVGGGGGGGVMTSISEYGGGGGAGQLLYYTDYTANKLTITIGQGGTNTSANTNGGNTIVNEIVAYGGGKGGYRIDTPDGANGGCGGGALKGNHSGGSAIYGAYGNDGGDSLTTTGSGGGGTFEAGKTNGVGGRGLSTKGDLGADWEISGSPINYGAGGQGGTSTSTRVDGAAVGNGGKGAGHGDDTAGTGGNGIVIIRYLGGTKATGGTITQSVNSLYDVAGYTIHTFTSNGTFEVI